MIKQVIAKSITNTKSPSRARTKMVFKNQDFLNNFKILAANSLFHALKLRNKSFAQEYNHAWTKPKSPRQKQTKKLQIFDRISKTLNERRVLVIWHDTINNSITKP